MFPIVVSAKPHPDLLDWTLKNSEHLKEQLATAGALLFKGTGITNAALFEEFSRLTSREFPDFREESSPRHVVEGAVQTSTDYPSAYSIQFHNEYSYASRWPMKLYFLCLVPAAQRGETPISNARAVLSGLRSETRALFEKKGILYVRNYRPNVGVSWQRAFMTHDRREVERSCDDANIAWEWREGDVLHTRQRTGAIVEHPATGEEVWFNHGFFFNVRALEPPHVRAVLESYPEDDPFSTNTLFGDGTPIPSAIIEELRALYSGASSAFEWQREDVLLIDNMLTAHSRAPYSGKRSIVVLMADECSRSAVKAVGERRARGGYEFALPDDAR